MNPSIDVALKSIVGAYSVIFAGIFVFVWLTFGRQRKLEKKLEQLREDLREIRLSKGEGGSQGR
jgi:CcmD family protein